MSEETAGQSVVIKKVRNALIQLRSLNKVSVILSDETDAVVISEYLTIPRFRFQWVQQRNYYRVFIVVYNKTTGAFDDVGYPAMIIGDALTAMDFCTMYRTLCKNKSKIGSRE